MALHAYRRGIVTDRTRRRIRASRRVPAPALDEPSDDEILCYLDGAMEGAERTAFEERLKKSPYAAARIELLGAALEENGWPVALEDNPALLPGRRGST
jgi:hypothetical protein